MVDLSCNNFSGPIPHELGALRNLVTLRMSSNMLTGFIPHNLGNCKQLVSLDLGSNLLNGSLPAEITTLGSLQNLLLSGNKLTGAIPDSFTATQALLELQLGDNLLEGAIPHSLGNLQYISKTLNISNNRLSGQIPSSLGNLQDLEVLDLSKNSLSGPIPQQLSNMISLLVVNMSLNDLSGQLPASWVKLAAQSPQGFLGNPQLCVQADNAPCSSKNLSVKNRTRNTRIIVALLLSALVVIVAGLFAVHYIAKRSRRLSAKRVSIRSLDSTEELPEDLSYEDIIRATDNWSEKYVIGRGRHGTVYRTESKLGKQWAVKTVDLSQSKFPVEMKILNTVKHRNIVRMAGYYIRGNAGLILYEFMPEGTLFELLHQRKPRVALDWSVRHQIALGLAQGLSYLHQDCVPMIVHRDVKSSNILMDADLVPKITDFGMGKIVGDEDADATVSVIVGTLGYIAPGTVPS
jgi:tRNA A-37 threonylcarbamoyl transferase component Bud32